MSLVKRAENSLGRKGNDHRVGPELQISEASPAGMISEMLPRNTPPEVPERGETGDCIDMEFAV